MSIEQASPAVLLSAALTKSDPEQGECLLTLSATEASELPMGRLSWFRLGRAVGDVIDVSPKIWINVK
jgi:hypothetical protein